MPTNYRNNVEDKCSNSYCSCFAYLLHNIHWWFLNNRTHPSTNTSSEYFVTPTPKNSPESTPSKQFIIVYDAVPSLPVKIPLSTDPRRLSIPKEELGALTKSKLSCYKIHSNLTLFLSDTS
ncbi:unnamed protein product [Lepeophtheirus salmonis]|uniref:(salmon louse) hypothetical protein n=1 Tax=Lepeophtheirus salmonis TaxID=72036 RepID=A0A7R8D2P9_LEPSM|nr:unnamed protein product [Lepeophtheirus salmonis]CAF3007402.1 unnamed protein product [Lepeophtheirus salmonis]